MTIKFDKSVNLTSENGGPKFYIQYNGVMKNDVTINYVSDNPDKRVFTKRTVAGIGKSTPGVTLDSSSTKALDRGNINAEVFLVFDNN